MDIYTTTVELAGGQIPTDKVIDGVNLIPYLTGEKEGQPHNVLFFRRKRDNYWSIRVNDYKWVYNGKNPEEEPEGGGLYNIQTDISESIDSSAELSWKREELKNLFFDITSDFPEPMEREDHYFMQLNLGLHEMSDYEFQSADYDKFPVSEIVNVDKNGVLGELVIQIDAILEGEPDKQLYLSRFQDCFSIAKDLETSIIDYRNINTNETFKFIFNSINLNETESDESMTVELTGISFKKMLGAEVAISKNNTEPQIIKGIEIVDDTTYIFPEPFFLIQGDTITLDTRSSRWRLSGLKMQMTELDPALNNLSLRPLEGRLKVYPNPAGEFLHVEGLGIKKQSVYITSLSGRMLYYGDDTIVDVSHFKPGMYLVKSGLQIKKFLKK